MLLLYILISRMLQWWATSTSRQNGPQVQRIRHTYSGSVSGCKVVLCSFKLCTSLGHSIPTNSSCIWFIPAASSSMFQCNKITHTSSSMGLNIKVYCPLLFLLLQHSKRGSFSSHGLYCHICCLLHFLLWPCSAWGRWWISSSISRWDHVLLMALCFSQVKAL